MSVSTVGSHAQVYSLSAGFACSCAVIACSQVVPYAGLLPFDHGPATCESWRQLSFAFSFALGGLPATLLLLIAFGTGRGVANGCLHLFFLAIAFPLGFGPSVAI